MHDDDPEAKDEIHVCAAVLDPKECPTSKLLSYFSQWTDLRRAVAWILKLKELLLLQRERKNNTISGGQARRSSQKVKPDTLKLSVSNLNNAEKAFFCFVQQQVYPEELAALRTGALKKTSHSFNLDPQIVDGVLRVGGRLHQSALPEEAKHPVIPPKPHLNTHTMPHSSEDWTRRQKPRYQPFDVATGYHMLTLQPERS